MNPSTPTSVRSLADLGTLFGREAPTPPAKQPNHKERRAIAYRKRRPTVRTSPQIPCTACGRRMDYADAVPRQIGDGWLGFAHPECEVDHARQAAFISLDESYRRHGGFVRGRIDLDTGERMAAL